MDSVFAQKEADIQYVLVDPGSTDGSRAIIQDKLKIYATSTKAMFEPDEGPADGLNKGFSQATGDIFGFINSDDYLLPGAIAAVEKCFNEHPSADIVTGNGLIVGPQGDLIRHITAKGLSLERFVRGGTAWLQQATFFRSSIFKKVGGFNVTNITSWDGELITEMLQAGASVAYVKQDLACFRIHQLSITGSTSSKDRYRSDRDRIFQSVYPEGWTIRHLFMRLLYRFELLLLSTTHRFRRVWS